MKKLYWNSIGTGNINLILIHGWGFNSKIWSTLIKSNFKKKFILHLIDLPGFGKSNKMPPMTLDNMIELLNLYIPDHSILLGWSMGGLIASAIGLKYPHKIKGIISVSSSPCFILRPNWPGISQQTLSKFYNQLNTNFRQSISNFIISQTKNSNIKDIENLIQKILSQPYPTTYTLKKTLEIIFLSDLRYEIKNLNIPMFRIYGSSDIFVPKEICNILDIMWPKTKSMIIKQSAHIPFVSHTQEFYKAIIKFINNLDI